MASGYHTKGEHAFVTIEKDLKSGYMPTVVLLCGKEEYLIRWYTEKLIQRYVSDACRAIDLVTLQGESLSFQNIMESLETVSLMSERKVVLVPDFLPAEGKPLKGFPESDIAALLGYMDEIPSDSMLILTVVEDDDYRKRGKKNELRSKIQRKGKVYDFQPLDDRLLRGFIEKRLKAAGLSYRSSVINLIMNSGGYGNKAADYNLYNLENDLKKLVAYSDGIQLTEDDVRILLSSTPENNVFAMLDAVGRNRKDEAFRLSHNLLNSGMPIFKLIKMIADQLELILSVKEMKESGMPLDAIQKKLGIHRFRVKKAMSMTGQYSNAHLRTCLASAYEMDENIKTGLFDGKLALEYFIAKI